MFLLLNSYLVAVDIFYAYFKFVEIITTRSLVPVHFYLYQIFKSWWKDCMISVNCMWVMSMHFLCEFGSYHFYQLPFNFSLLDFWVTMWIHAKIYYLSQKKQSSPGLADILSIVVTLCHFLLSFSYLFMSWQILLDIAITNKCFLLHHLFDRFKNYMLKNYF